MLALEHDMIGMASTNSVRYGAPTFGKDVLLGTNPLAYAIPAKEEPAFVLDFATTTVPKGKLEVYKRKGLPLKDGWAIDANGFPTHDPDEALRGALLPLGGFGTDNSGHKGYGLGLLVDILCGVLSGGKFGTGLPLVTDTMEGAISHWFGAFRVDAFRDVEEFKADMDRELRAFKESRKVPDQERIYVAGEPEFIKTAYHREHGVPVHAKVWDGLEKLASELAHSVRARAVTNAFHAWRAGFVDGAHQCRLARGRVHGRQCVVFPVHRASCRGRSFAACRGSRGARDARRNPSRVF